MEDKDLGELLNPMDGSIIKGKTNAGSINPQIKSSDEMKTYIGVHNTIGRQRSTLKEGSNGDDSLSMALKKQCCNSVP